MTQRIDSFVGYHRFLSNFSPHGFYSGDVWYPTNEHYFQAMKTKDEKERLSIVMATSPGEAKKLGRLVTLRSDWDKIKISVMKIGVKNKFDQNPSIKQLLMETGDAELIEGNTWKDTFWGVCNGVGENWLGKILMDLRSFYYGNDVATIYFGGQHGR